MGMSVLLYIIIVCCLLTGFIGLFVRNRFAMGRDSRKEFKAVAERIAFALLKAKENPSPHAKWPDEEDLFLLRNMVSAWRRHSFDDARNRFKQIQYQNTQKDAMGNSFYENEAPIVEAIERLMTFVRRK